MSNLNLLPAPRSLKLLRGTFTLPKQKPLAAIKAVRTKFAPNHLESDALTISKNGIEISYRETGGLRALNLGVDLPLVPALSREHLDFNLTERLGHDARLDDRAARSELDDGALLRGTDHVLLFYP